MIRRVKQPGNRRRLGAIALALFLAASATAHADHDRRFRETDEQRIAPRAAAERRVTLEQAIQSVQRATRGRVLDAREVRGEYRIKVLTPRGEVRVVYVDAQSGAMR